ncbi:MAG: hypothetical protein WB579_07220 [Bryobacteraceae bacterium]
MRLIGEGGMGAVYEAEQAKPRRTVALKVIKLGPASDFYRQRFEIESQALALLQHPGIAQIYAAGTATTSVGMGPDPIGSKEVELDAGQEVTGGFRDFRADPSISAHGLDETQQAVAGDGGLRNNTGFNSGYREESHGLPGECMPSSD